MSDNEDKEDNKKENNEGKVETENEEEHSKKKEDVAETNSDPKIEEKPLTEQEDDTEQLTRQKTVKFQIEDEYSSSAEELESASEDRLEQLPEATSFHSLKLESSSKIDAGDEETRRREAEEVLREYLENVRLLSAPDDDEEEAELVAVKQTESSLSDNDKLEVKKSLSGLIADKPVFEEQQEEEAQEDSLRTVDSESSTEIYQFLRNFGKQSSGRSSLVTEAFIYMIIPPDGGYGWTILVLSFFCQSIVDGLLFSLGSLLPDLSADLQLSSSQAALISSMQLGFYYFTGPVASAFINKYSFRKVAVSGAIIATLSVVISSFLTTYLVLLIIYGAFAGIGFGMIWVSSQLIIGYYFEKYRPIAAGVACAGGGAGVLVFSAFNQTVTSRIGWRNTIRTHAVFAFLVGIMALLYRPVKPTKVGRVMEVVEDDDESESVESFEIASAFYSRFLPSTTDLTTSRKNMSYSDIGNIPHHPRLVTYYSKEGFFSRYYHKFCTCCPSAPKPRRSSSPFPTKRYVFEQGPLNRADIFYQGRSDYTRNVEVDHRDDIQLIPGKETMARSIQYTLSVMRTSRSRISTTKKRLFSPKLLEAINVLFDLQLLRVGEFQLLLLSAFLFSFGLNIPFVYAAVRANEYIGGQYSRWMPPLIGITNIIFRLIAGVLSYKVKTPTEYLCGGGMAAGGFFTLLSGWIGMTAVWYQFVFIIFFAMGASCFSALRSIIYVKILGLDNLTTAFGITAMIMGFGIFSGTFCAGVLNGLTGDYNSSFLVSGGSMLIAGCLKLSLPKARKWRSRHDDNREAKLRLMNNKV